MTRMSLKTYTVYGGGQFPLDMLRYDCAWPATQEDVAAIDYHADRGRRSVVLNSYSEPTVARWNSFMWSVKDGIDRNAHTYKLKLGDKKKVVPFAPPSDEVPDVIDVSDCQRDAWYGDYILERFEEGKDYRVNSLNQLIWSIGKHKKTGVIKASVTSRFYENPVYECLWLR